MLFKPKYDIINNNITKAKLSMFEYINIIVSIVIFLATFWVMITEKAHRAVIAFFGAVIMAIVWNGLGFYSSEAILNSIDFNTILLLFGMMLIVAELEKTWFFQYLAIKTAKKTWWNLWYLIVYLWALTSGLSMFLDNVTTIILVVPVTLIITKLLKLNPVPILMAVAMLSNIGWVATLIWDPPNIIIWSAAGYGFNTFIIHSLPVVFVVWIIVLGFFRYYYREEFTHPQKGLKALMRMDEKKCIQNSIILKKTLIILTAVIILFFLHEIIHMSASAVALLWAASLVLWVSPHKDPKSIFKKVELSVLVFFVSLFVLVGWIEQAWVLNLAVDAMWELAQSNMLLTAIYVLWGSALLSALIWNIPMAVALIPVIAMLQSKWIYWVDMLWWALVFWVWFGCNITPIWSAAWLIVYGKAESNKTPISLKQWLKVWIPSTFFALSIASLALMLFEDFFMI